ncbi:MAG: hypothetical protein R3F30_15700 [Planctomycetota bacterium]
MNPTNPEGSPNAPEWRKSNRIRVIQRHNRSQERRIRAFVLMILGALVIGLYLLFEGITGFGPP